METENTINWVLDRNQAQYVLSILAERPYKESSQLINSLVQQSNQSMQPEQNEPEKKGPINRKKRTNGKSPSETMQ